MNALTRFAFGSTLLFASTSPLSALAQPAPAEDAGERSEASAAPTAAAEDAPAAEEPAAAPGTPPPEAGAPESEPPRSTGEEAPKAGGPSGKPPTKLEPRKPEATRSEEAESAPPVWNRFGFDGAATSTHATGQAKSRVEITVGAQLMYLDVDGPGGFSNRDADTIRPTTRSPYVELDRATFDARGHITPWMHARIRLRGDDNGARIDRAYLQAEPIGKLLMLRGGYDLPLQRVDRRTNTWGPLGGAFWRGQQYTLGAMLRLDDAVYLRVAPSVQFQRPLGDDYPTNDEALPALTFIDANPGESNPLEAGGLAMVGAFGASVGGFGFVGELRDNEDVLFLQRLFPTYELAGDPDSRTSRWYGGRFVFDRFGIWVHAEKIWAVQGLLQREGHEVTASYTQRFEVSGQHIELEPIARYSVLDIKNFPAEYQVPETWDREQLLFGMLIRPHRFIELKVERVLQGERAGTSREGKTSVENDELLVMLGFEVSDENF